MQHYRWITVAFPLNRLDPISWSLVQAREDPNEGLNFGDMLGSSKRVQILHCKVSWLNHFEQHRESSILLNVFLFWEPWLMVFYSMFVSFRCQAWVCWSLVSKLSYCILQYPQSNVHMKNGGCNMDGSTVYNVYMKICLCIFICICTLTYWCKDTYR